MAKLERNDAILKLVFSKENFASAVSGSLASMVALGLFYPLDRVRGLAQLKDKQESALVIIKELVKSEGWEGLYVGIKHMLLVLGCSNFVYFYCNSFLKVLYIQKMNQLRLKRGQTPIGAESVSNLMHLLLASISGVINVLTTAPLWLVATRLAMRRKAEQSLPDEEPMIQPETAVKKLEKLENNVKVDKTKPTTSKRKSVGFLNYMIGIAKYEGPAALWSGTAASLILVSNPAIQFAAYERLKKIALKAASNRSLTSVEFLILGALSKMIATIFTYPLQLSQTRLRSLSQKNMDPNRQKNSTTIGILLQIYKNDGLKGWFKGMDAKLTQTCLTAAFMFAFYEKFFAISTKLLKSNRA